MPNSLVSCSMLFASARNRRRFLSSFYAGLLDALIRRSARVSASAGRFDVSPYKATWLVAVSNQVAPGPHKSSVRLAAAEEFLTSWDIFILAGTAKPANAFGASVS